jgi:hypothetical protein
MKTNEIKMIFDYNFWAFERIWERICQISDEQFIEQIDYSTGSIRNIVAHIMSANRNWMHRLRDTKYHRVWCMKISFHFLKPKQPGMNCERNSWIALTLLRMENLRELGTSRPWLDVR